MLEFLDSRSTLLFAVLVVTWAAIAMLALIAVNLHVRLQKAERATASSQPTLRPFSQLLGRSVRELLGEPIADPLNATGSPRLLLFLSQKCTACDRLLDRLESGEWDSPAALLWTDRQPERSLRLPANVQVLSGGPEVSSALGIRVTPFALLTNEAGEVIDAAPVNQLPDPGAPLSRPVGTPGSTVAAAVN